MEDWKIGKMEYWNGRKDGRMGNIKHGGTESTEKHREERIEESENGRWGNSTIRQWKNGRMEKWKNGIMENRKASHSVA